MGEITWGTLVAILAAPSIFLLPGGALLSLLLPPESFMTQRRPGIATWLALAAGLTLALPPVLLLALYLVGIKIGTGAVLVYLAASAGVIAWCWRPALRQRMSWREWMSWLDAPLLALILVMILIVGVRLWVVRGINVGYWGDSYQHTMIAQLMLDNGGLFQSWAPYVPLRSFTYHFGFHGNAALFQWATGWLAANSTPRAVVLVGQFLNALAALTLYPLAVRLGGGNRWAGVAAVLSAGLLTSMPMFYTNWGRYTQLAGQAILPVAIWLTMEAVEAPRRGLRRVVVAALAVAGLGLTHYRISIFYAVFMVPYVACLFLARWRSLRQMPWWWVQPLARLAAVGLLALLLAGPWIWHLRSGQLPNNLASYHQGALPDSFSTQYNAFEWTFSPNWLAWLALAGAGWALVRRRRAVLAAFWAGLLLAIANTSLVGLPDTGLFNNFAVMIGLYIPVSILDGYLVGDLVALAASRWPGAQKLAALLFALVAVIGTLAQADPLVSSFQIVTPEDEQAMAWIRENTPPEARFLANSFFAFGDYVIVGSDAGWWLPLLAGRSNTVPPATYSMEAADPPDYREQVNAVARQVAEGDLDDPQMVAFLQSQGITHVYVGRVGGPLLVPEILRRSPYYELIYEAGGVLIFVITDAG